MTTTNSSSILILGFGEIGRSVRRLYTNKAANHTPTIYVKDLAPKRDELDGAIVIGGIDEKSAVARPKGIDVLHVCIPFTDAFVATVAATIKDCKAALTIIHATVPPGTTRAIHAITKTSIAHSYVTGKHPNLTESLRTFVKPVGGIDEKSTAAAVAHLKGIGVPAIAFKSPETSEIAKIADTTNYFANLLHMKEVHALCARYGADFDQAYNVATENYNNGYDKMGLAHFKRQNLKFIPGEIGGHCVVPNAKILKNVCKSSWAVNLLKAYDDILKEEKTNR